MVTDDCTLWRRPDQRSRNLRASRTKGSDELRLLRRLDCSEESAEDVGIAVNVVFSRFLNKGMQFTQRVLNPIKVVPEPEAHLQRADRHSLVN